MNSANYWIDKLALQRHPEGGWFKEVYRCEEDISQKALPNNISGDRNISTGIYYLLEGEEYSSFHRIKSDEMWHFYTGTSGIEILWILNGELKKSKLGKKFDDGEYFQFVIPRNTWFAARLLNNSGYALVGCTVSPGFHFDDFELANASLMEEFPSIKHEIIDLIKA